MQKDEHIGEYAGNKEGIVDKLVAVPAYRFVGGAHGSSLGAAGGGSSRTAGASCDSFGVARKIIPSATGSAIASSVQISAWARLCGRCILSLLLGGEQRPTPDDER